MEAKYITIQVSNISKQLDFYTQKLGYQVLKKTRILNGTDSVILKRDQSEVGIILMEFTKNHSRNMVILNTNDCLKDYHLLKEKGVKFETGPEYVSAGLAVSFLDPSENRWFLLEEREYKEN